MEDHIEKECDKILKKCEKCELFISKKEFDNHDCMEMMKKRYLENKSEIDTLSSKYDINSLDRLNQRCKLGKHLMV